MSSFVTGIAVATAYLIFKFIEMRLILKENKPLKILVRDTLLVYLSVILGNFIMEQIGGNNMMTKIPQVFTNDPNF